MFKVGEIKQVSNEKVIIKPVEYEKGHFENGKTNYEMIRTLTFKITGDDYSFEFMMRKELTSLLDIPMNEQVDFKDYLFMGETFFNVKNETSCIDPDMDIKIYRYLENSYEITIHCYPYESDSTMNYSGFIQFSFDLNEFLDSKG